MIFHFIHSVIVYCLALLLKHISTFLIPIRLFYLSLTHLFSYLWDLIIMLYIGVLADLIGI